jgi:hypothetical protein
MRAFVSQHLKVIVAVVVTLVVATAVPTLAAGGFDADNARRVGGHKLDQLSSTSYVRVHRVIDDFDGCHYSPILKRRVSAPANGYLTVTSTVAAARSTDDVNPALLVTRLMVDGKTASSPSSVNLENDGVLDATNVNQGVAKVKRGRRVVTIQAKECGDGIAFILDRQLIAQYSPTGSIRR